MRHRRSALLIAAALAASGCLGPAPPPSAPPPEVAPNAAVVALTSIPVATVASWLGTYRSGADTLTLRQSGTVLVAERNGQPPMTLSFVGLGTFADAAGTSYLITKAGLRTVAANGSTRDWAR